MNRHLFPKEEFALRLKRASRLMKERGIDALFVTGEENFTYFTGAASLIPWRSFTRPVFALLPAEGEPVMVVHKSLEEDARCSSPYREVRAYSQITGSPIELIKEVFRERGLEKGRIGAELGLEQRLGMPYLDYVKLTEGLKEARFIDASSLLWELRMIKSDLEVECIRETCELTRRAREKCIESVREGMTEWEVARIFGSNMIMEGAEGVSFTQVKAGRPSGYTPTDRQLKKGDLVYLDGGCYVKRLTCDYARLAVVGRPSSEQIRLHRLICGISRRMAEALKPGVRCSEIAEFCLREYRRAGLPIHEGGRVGHGQGMLPTEPPSLAPHDHTILKPGMVVSTEPGLVVEHGLYLWEDVYVIVEEGFDQLSREAEDLREIQVL